jgi:hypothetical protein
MSTPTLQQLQDQLDRDLATIDARLAADLGDLDAAAEIALPFDEFMARCVRRLAAAAEKKAVIAEAQKHGALVTV